ncbi:hypothetical protein ANCCAN_18793 [Ancylostoma caninum]|uniref:Uncharacterized protein n=1 Tax=Ancylostoma caninum TaxID=29170 RepID=A0A368FX58_ANCCA|nr:hypothetical protein ANCCAN_18793 [Ancylostoma caninum]
MLRELLSNEHQRSVAELNPNGRLDILLRETLTTDNSRNRHTLEAELDRNGIALKARMSPVLGNNRKGKVKPDLTGVMNRKMVAPISRLALTPEPPQSEPVFDRSGPLRKHETSTAAMSSMRITVDTILKFLMMSALIRTVKLIPMRSYQTLDTISVDLIGLRLPRLEEDRIKWRTAQG